MRPPVDPTPPLRQGIRTPTSASAPKPERAAPETGYWTSPLPSHSRKARRPVRSYRVWNSGSAFAPRPARPRFPCRQETSREWRFDSCGVNDTSEGSRIQRVPEYAAKFLPARQYQQLYLDGNCATQGGTMINAMRTLLIVGALLFYL